MRIPVPDEILPAADLGRVHCVGIGGAGISAIARIMAARGIPVTGSDDHDTPFLPSLRALGVTCHLGYDAAHVGDPPDPPSERDEVDVGIETAERLRGHFHLASPDVRRPVQDLAVEVAQLDRVVVHRDDAPHAGAGESRHGPRPEPS